MGQKSLGGRGRALTVPQVCDELSVNRRTVYQLIESGALRAYRVGKPYRIDPEDLMAFKERRKADTSADGAASLIRVGS